MYRNFNLFAFASQLIPPILRKRGISALVQTMLAPLNDIVKTFNSVVSEADKRINDNGFVVYLEKFLNDLFGLSEVIYIEDRLKDYSIYLNQKSEGESIWMTTKAEGDDTLAVPSDKPGKLIGGFAVCIPKHLNTLENIQLITKWVDYYRYAGTNYIIEIYG